MEPLGSEEPWFKTSDARYSNLMNANYTCEDLDTLENIMYKHDMTHLYVPGVTVSGKQTT